MLFPKDSGDLFAVQVLVNVKMMNRVFEPSPVFTIHRAPCRSDLDSLRLSGMSSGRSCGGRRSPENCAISHVLAMICENFHALVSTLEY